MTRARQLAVVTCICPHCATKVRYTGQGCAKCGGTLDRADFAGRMREVCELERMYRLGAAVEVTA